MSIKLNKVIIPNDYKEIILDEPNGDALGKDATLGDLLGNLEAITINLSNLDLSPKMSYVAEVKYICESATYTEIYGNPNGNRIYRTLQFNIDLDKNTASKYRFFRFYLSPNIDIYNDTKNISGISSPSPMGVKMQLNINIKDSELIIFTKTFERSLIKYVGEDDGVIELGQGLLMSGSGIGIFFKTFKFIFDSLTGTITDEAPDVFGSITEILTT